MTKVILALGAAATALGLGAVPAPAVAQQTSSEVIVYGNDPCPRGSNGAVVVCRHRPEKDRYRLPQNQHNNNPHQKQQTKAIKAKKNNQTDNTRPMSCSAVGPGGHTGCLI